DVELEGNRDRGRAGGDAEVDGDAQPDARLDGQVRRAVLDAQSHHAVSRQRRGNPIKGIIGAADAYAEVHAQRRQLNVQRDVQADIGQIAQPERHVGDGEGVGDR